MKKMYIYILLCADDSLYVGVTNNLERRLKEHQSALHENSYTASRLPVELVYYEVYNGPKAAIAREKQLKKWSRAKKQALINNNEKLLKELSKKDFSQ